MNFHKKIGFLAALLLMFGLGVPDGFAQLTISAAAPNPASITEGGDATPVSITATLSAPPGTGNTAAVVFTPDKFGNPVTVNVSGNTETEAIGTLSLTAAEDADVNDDKVIVNITAAGHTGTTATVTVTDDDGITVGAPAPTSITEGAGTTTVTIEATLSAPPGTGNTVKVVFTPDKFGNPATVNISGNTETQGTATLYLTATDDTDTENDKVIVTVAIEGSTSTTATVTVKDDDRLTISSINPSSLVEGSDNTTVTVTAALSAAPGDGNTVTVTARAYYDGAQLPTDTTPVTALIGDSNASASLELDALRIPDNDGQQGDRNIQIIVSATSTVAADVYLDATDNLILKDAQSIALTLDDTAMDEGATPTGSGDLDGTVNAIVRLPAAPGDGNTVVVTVTPSGYAEAIALTVSGGGDNANGNLLFTIPHDNNTFDETITVTATATGYVSDTKTLTIEDDDEGTITLKINPSTLKESTGGDVSVDVELSDDPDADVQVTVNAVLDGTGITLATSVLTVIGTGTGKTASGSLTINSIKDSNLMNKTVTVSAEAATYAKDTKTLTLVDEDMGTLTLTRNPSSITEGVTTNVVVTVVASPLPAVVTLTPSANGSPVTVTVNDASATGTLSLSPPEDDDAADGSITITATADRYNTATTAVTVTDDDKTGPKITITTDPSMIREDSRNKDIEVTATLPAAPGTGNTVVVTVVAMGDTPTTGTISISGSNTTGTTTVSLVFADDDVHTNRSITVNGRADGYQSHSVKVTIWDDDPTIGTLTITKASPPSINAGSGAKTVTLTVKGALKDKLQDSGTVTATLTTTAGTFPNGTMTDQLTISMRDHVDLIPDQDAPDGTKTIKLDLSADDVKTAGTRITVTASADTYDTGSRVISIRDRDAIDVQGYRLALVKPAADGWANENNDQVIVDLIRVGSVAYPWTEFDSIKVSVRDTAHDNSASPFVINQVTASNFNREDNGAITFDEGGDRGDVIWRGNDTIRFEIKIKRCAGAVIADDKCGGDYPSVKGQFLGAYVVADFTVGSTVSSLSNKDSEKPVYPSNPTLIDEANRYVGDGKLFKVDNLDPSNEALSPVSVTILDAKGERTDSLKVGNEIHVAVQVSGDKLFRENGLRIQLKPRDGKWKVDGQALDGDTDPDPLKDDSGNDSSPVTKTVNFNVAQIIASVSDSLRTSWKITEGFFQFKTDDYIEGIGPKGKVFEADDTFARVFVAIKDQAGNWSSDKTSGWYNADSRSPKVRIRYPAADPDSIFDHTYPMRFTGGIEGDDIHEEHLNPLRIEVDEDLSMLQVFAVGADTLDLDFSSGDIADSTATYNTSALNSPKKDKNGVWIPSSKNIAGTEIDLVVLATDRLGNVTKESIANVIHDAAPPEIKDWFPKNSLLQDDQFNDATPPVFTLREDVDSISVRFMSHALGGKDVTQVRGGVTSKGEDSIDFTGKLQDEIRYTMTIYTRDLAGNVAITPPDSSMNMRFNAEFDNPVASRYKIKADRDSVIAGQANILTIQAEDHDADSNTARNALTYKNKARISAWDASGGAAASVWFEGTGVDDDADNPDGEAMLSAADWRIGKRTVTVKSNKALNHLKILVQHLDSGMGDTAVVGFENAIDSLYIGAADFAAFEITAEDDVEGVIWGDYTLRVVPTDRYGNPSVRAFQSDPAGSDFTSEDSLAVLDTRMSDNNVFEYKKGIDVEIVGIPTIEDFALLVLTIAPGGSEYDLVAPADRRFQTVQVRVSLSHLLKDDTTTRNRDIRSTAKFTISKPLTPTLSVLDSEGNDVTGQDVVIPADGDATVTVAAEGYNAGDMVTFTRNDTAMDPVAANDDGVAKLDITASMAGTTTVSATDGRYSTDALTITFVDTPPEPDRKSYVDANGDPVYLIYTGDAPPDMTVGTDDFLALVAAFGSSDGDDNYNAQADVNDDGTVNVADYLEFIKSYGRTAAGPATKPLVLLPGINENAEFSLSLGSERVVAGELVAVDVSLANVEALTGYGFALNYETDKFEFVSVAPADEDLLKSTGGETLFHHVVADGQITVANGLYNGTAISGGGDVVRFVFRVLREFEDNARFEIADGLVFDPSQLQNPAVVAGVLELQSTPREFALHQNFPNPFNPDTTIKYDLAESADVTLQIYNVLGQVVRTLVASEAQNAGRYQIRWNGMDDRGVPVSSGIYFYQISADGKFSDVRKLMLLK